MTRSLSNLVAARDSKWDCDIRFARKKSMAKAAKGHKDCAKGLFHPRFFRVKKGEALSLQTLQHRRGPVHVVAGRKR
jgi:hypothetical protein